MPQLKKYSPILFFFICISFSGMKSMQSHLQEQLNADRLQNDREHLYEALQMAASGKVKVMTEIYPLSDAPKVYEKVKQGKVRFRAVLSNF